MRIALNRNRATRVAAWIAVIFLAALSAAHAQESRYALIIGVSEYSDPNVSALTGVASDIRTARSIASSMGIPEANMRVLRDKDATKQNVIAELQALSRRVPAGGRAFIYFSGHGTRWHDPTLNACAEGLMTYDTKTVSSDEIAQYTRRISEVADKTGALTFWGTQAFFWGRLAYIPLYAAGTPYLRSLAWMVATLGLMAVLAALFLP